MFTYMIHITYYIYITHHTSHLSTWRCTTIAVKLGRSLGSCALQYEMSHTHIHTQTHGGRGGERDKVDWTCAYFRIAILHILHIAYGTNNLTSTYPGGLCSLWVCREPPVVVFCHAEQPQPSACNPAWPMPAVPWAFPTWWLKSYRCRPCVWLVHLATLQELGTPVFLRGCFQRSLRTLCPWLVPSRNRTILLLRCDRSGSHTHTHTYTRTHTHHMCKIAM